jgi:competence protein ComEC
MQRLRASVKGGLRTQLIATLGLTPLTLVFFQQVSLVGFAANLVAIPLVTLVITPLALLGVLFSPLWLLGAGVQNLFAIGLTWLGQVPGAVWLAPVAPLWAQLAGLCAAALMVLPLPWRLRLLSVPLVMPLLLPVRDLPAEGRYDLLAVDVGQGTAVLVRTRQHLMVYDAGPQYSRDSDAGQRVLLPLLRARGETRIDRLVLSHRDLDHVGGAAALLKNMQVTELLSSLEAGHPLLALASRPVRCEAGQSWRWDGVHFEVLHPQPADYERALKSNAMSCVVKVSSPQGTALLTGDIERQQEAQLLATQRDALRSDLLLVPHHGSRTSSTDGFLDAVAPREAVVQAGYRNRFGHPVAEVIDRLQDRGALVHTSPGCGAWHWAGPSQGFCEREVARRYWHHAGHPTEHPTSRPE